jgi:dihydrofolate synthase / folylpolyglutamate synthase
MAASDAILERLSSLHPKAIDLSLGRIEALLEKLGRPQDRLPPVFHVAGTNGKGSTCAYLRACLEAAGHRVHVYTSPHLVRFHERIRLAGSLIGEDALTLLLDEVERVNAGAPITFFEVTTAAALLAFARIPADALVLEVGMGGRYDTTNVVSRPAVTIVTPVSYDHQSYLGDTLTLIAGEKAGILKSGAPAVIGPQEDESLRALTAEAERLGVPIKLWGQDFSAHEENGRLIYQDETALLDMARPRLPGAHQIVNAAAAIAALRVQTALKVPDGALERGLVTASWPGRMQRLTMGPLFDALPQGAELWLDGGHNPHAGAAIASLLADMEEARPRPLYLVAGMLTTKDAGAFLAQFRGLARHVTTVGIAGDAAAYGAGALYDLARAAGLSADPVDSLDDAMHQIAARAGIDEDDPPPRVLICGSLRLAGLVLRENE